MKSLKELEGWLIGYGLTIKQAEKVIALIEKSKENNREKEREGK